MTLPNTNIVPNRAIKQVISVLSSTRAGEEVTLIEKAKNLAAVVSGENPEDLEAVSKAVSAVHEFLKSERDASVPEFARADMKRKVNWATGSHNCSIPSCTACESLIESMDEIIRLSVVSTQRAIMCAKHSNRRSRRRMDAHDAQFERVEELRAKAQDAYRTLMSAQEQCVTVMTCLQKEMDVASVTRQLSKLSEDEATTKERVLKEIKGSSFNELSVKSNESDPEIQQSECFKRVISTIKSQPKEFCASEDVKFYLSRYQDACIDSVDGLCDSALLRNDSLALALCHLKGFCSFKQDSNKARQILEMLSELHSDCNEISFVLYQCLEMFEEASAMQHLEKAAHGGLPCAQVEMFLREDIPQAVQEEWLKKAVDQKMPAALRLNAIMNHGGLDTEPKDIDAWAISHFDFAQSTCVPHMEEACKYGDLLSSYWLGIYHKYGYGVEKNIPAAAQFFLDAAKAPHYNQNGSFQRGDPAAMYQYGLILTGVYGNFGGSLRSSEEGCKWIARARLMNYEWAERYMDKEWTNMASNVLSESDDMFCLKTSVKNPCFISREMQKLEGQSALLNFGLESSLRGLSKGI